RSFTKISTEFCSAPVNHRAHKLHFTGDAKKSLRIVIALLASGLLAVAEEDVEKGQQQRIAELFDQQLNDVYQRVTDSATREHAQNIREAQRSWLKYRDAE